MAIEEESKSMSETSVKNIAVVHMTSLDESKRLLKISLNVTNSADKGDCLVAINGN